LVEFKQARWNEPTVFELGSPGRRGVILPRIDEDIRKSLGELEELVPPSLLRNDPPDLPELSEVEVVRHFTRLSQMNYSVDQGMYPLGSCTMKYSPKLNEKIVKDPKAADIHPYQPEDTIQGALAVVYQLSRWLAEITGTHEVSLQPAAGAQGEFVGAMIMRAYHRKRGDLSRTEIIVPDSAHGTNPASASMAGFKVVVLPSGADGCVDLESLKAALSNRTAGLMLTNPNTLGIFEKNIVEMARLTHDAGGLLHYDGANLNAILGRVRPGDMGFDIVHVNLHKTFSTPHGGGGPGSGPVGVVESLEQFLPTPIVRRDGDRYWLDYNLPDSIGRVKSFYGNFSVLLRAYAYILTMGEEGLRDAAELSLLNTNYLVKQIQKIRGFTLPYSPETPRKHECVFSAKNLSSDTGVRALNVAKSLLDEGIHAPTIYFPLIVEEALMIEPTDTETLEELDRFTSALQRVSNNAYQNPDRVLNAPTNTSVSRLDEVKASHPKTLCLSWKICKLREETQMKSPSLSRGNSE